MGSIPLLATFLGDPIMRMYKFELYDSVFIKPFNRDGVVVSQSMSITPGQPVKIEYEVAMNEPRWDEHYGGMMEFLGKRYKYVRVHESDLCLSVHVTENWQLDSVAALHGFTRHPMETEVELRNRVLESMRTPEPEKKYDKGFEIKLKECECGKEKHGFASHSHWCPVFVPID
jgi:hypothetical protein